MDLKEAVRVAQIFTSITGKDRITVTPIHVEAIATLLDFARRSAPEIRHPPSCGGSEGEWCSCGVEQIINEARAAGLLEE